MSKCEGGQEQLKRVEQGLIHPSLLVKYIELMQTDSLFITMCETNSQYLLEFHSDRLCDCYWRPPNVGAYSSQKWYHNFLTISLIKRYFQIDFISPDRTVLPGEHKLFLNSTYCFHCSLFAFTSYNLLI